MVKLKLKVSLEMVFELVNGNITMNLWISKTSIILFKRWTKVGTWIEYEENGDIIRVTEYK